MANIVYLNNSQIILITECYAFIVIVYATIAKCKYLSNSNSYGKNGKVKLDILNIVSGVEVDGARRL